VKFFRLVYRVQTFSKNSWPKLDPGVALLDEQMIHSILTSARRCSGQTKGIPVQTAKTNPVSILIAAIALGTSSLPLRADSLQGTATMVTGDFNRDGRPDFGVVNQDSATVSVFLQNSNGTFQAALISPARANPSALAVGDLNGDGIPDLVVRNSTDMSALLGNGDGTFQTPKVISLPSGHSFYQAAYNPIAPALGDFDRDGHLDLVFTAIKNTGEYYMDVLLGKGDGTFRNGGSRLINASGSGSFEALVTGDFTGDGNLDVLTCASYGTIGGVPDVFLNLFPGDGAGNLLPTILTNHLFGSQDVVALAAGDFNGDGRLDFVVNAYSPGTTNPSLVGVMLNVGNTNFTPTLCTAYAGTPRSFAAGDVSGDGRPDILAIDEYTGTVHAFVGNGDGTFQRHLLTSPLASPSVVALADFNSDGFLDVGLAGPASTNIATLLTLNLFSGPRMATTGFSSGKFYGRVLGVSGQKQVIEASSNMVNWTAVATNQAGAATFNFTNTTTWKQGYYRARIIP